MCSPRTSMISWRNVVQTSEVVEVKSNFTVIDDIDDNNFQNN